ncbi:MAG: 30S ribosomal protein S20 [Planctomycetaceae bacterium]|nr:30S ribosomal protein S20 [Planctomycetaceae bacterium]
MPNSVNAKKRLRQSLDRRDRHRATRSTLRTQIRKLRKAVADGDKDAAQTELKVTVKALDRAAAKGIIHKNAAARTKSRLNKAVKEIAA